MKRGLYLIATVAISTMVMTSCNKGVVKVKKLDGEWTVTSGTMDGSYSSTYNGVTSTSTSSGTYNGSVLTVTTTSGGTSYETEEELTIAFTFDKETNDYTRTDVSTDPEYYETTITYYNYDSSLGYYVYGGTLTQTVSRVSTTTRNGIFTLTGDAGEDLEKNSQIVFQESDNSTSYEDTYTYKSGTTEVSNVSTYYYYDGGQYVLLPTAGEGTVTNVGSSSSSEIWTVETMEKGEMTVHYMDENDHEDTGSDYSYHNTTEYNWTLTQK